MTRSASWLELFFDLGYVAFIAQLTYTIDPNSSFWELSKYLLIFLVVFQLWWITTLHRNINKNEDRKSIILTQIQLFFLMIISVSLSYMETLSLPIIIFWIIWARITILYMIYSFHHAWKHPEKKMLENSKNNILLGYVFSTVWYIFIPFLSEAHSYFYMILFLVFDFLLLNIREKWHKSPLIRLDHHHIYERFWLFKTLVIGESLLVVALVSEGSKNLFQADYLFYAISGFFALCSMWWAYFPMLEDELKHQEIKSMNRFLASHVAIFLGVILFAIGIKGAMESFFQDIDQEFSWYLLMGIIIYIFGNSSLLLLHNKGKYYVSQLIIWGGSIVSSVCIYMLWKHFDSSLYLSLSLILGIFLLYAIFMQKRSLRV